jgi:sugar lactone lactonase YvrE
MNTHHLIARLVFCACSTIGLGIIILTTAVRTDAVSPSADRPLVPMDRVGTAWVTGFPDTTIDRQVNYAATLGYGPSGVAIATNGRIYVAIYKQNRVYSYPDASSLNDGVSPDIVFGDWNGNPDVDGCATSGDPRPLCGPESVAVDSAGNLYVGDTYNNRVVVYHTPTGSDQASITPDIVLGQPDMTTTWGGDFAYARGVALDANNNVYVADEMHHRVLRYSQPLSTGMSPDLVLGQSGMAETDPGATLDHFNLPVGMAIDGNGSVYVADYYNSRVLRFDAPLATGATAAQSFPDLSNPTDVAIDLSGNLYVADTLNQRVQVFSDPRTSDTQADYTFPNQDVPMGMAFDNVGNFYLTDCGSATCDSGARALKIYDATPVEYNFRLFLPSICR